MIVARLGLAALALSAAAAQAQDLCADRPGKGTPACVIDPGAVQLETSLADWSRTDRGATREDDLLFGDTLARIGIGGDVELRGGFTAYERDRTRSPAGTGIAGGFGDIALGARWQAIDGGDKRVSVAVQPTMTLPVGAKAVSQGTWSLELVVPVDMPLSGNWSLNLSPTLAAAADADGDGRHAAYGGSAGLSYDVSDAVTLGGELWAMRDDDPAGHETQASANLTLAWAPGKNWQLDLSGYAGLTRATPDIELVAGLVRRF